MFEISKADVNNMILWITTIISLLSFIIALFTFVLRRILEKNLLEKNNVKKIKIRNIQEKADNNYDDDDNYYDILSIFNKDVTQEQFFENQETLSYLRKQIKSDTIFKTVSFYVAIVMAITGTIILIIGAVVYNANEIKSTLPWITTFSGALMDVMSTVFFWLVNRTMKEVRKNSEQLERIENLFNAVLIAKNISDNNTKDTIYKDMIYKLMNIKMISR